MSKKELHKFVVFADGACSGNPGPGGWGAIVSDETRVVELGGYHSTTTNNRMELEAVYQALKNIHARQSKAQITIYTDSNYVVQGITKWISSWKKNSWKTLAKEEVKNKDLWIKLDEIFSEAKEFCSIEWKHVDGHSGIPGNERADEIAASFSKRDEIELFDGLIENYSVDLTYLMASKVPKAKSKSKSKGKVFYLSLVNGKVFRDETWKACEARVKNQRGAKYKKFSSPEEEREILHTWGVL